mmetsp:Transcript_21469/g.48766  ORF Transcript_21469/g.48766 Transcript_21469/m.48766 type:complete len:462 (-) Transcript_21469:983-2368(-)
MGLCHRQPLRSGALSDHSQQTRSGGLPGDTDGQTPGNEQQRVGLRHQRCPWRGTSGAPPLRRQNHARRHPRLRLLRPILQTPGAVQHGLGRRHPPLPPRDPRLPRRPGGNRRRRNPPQRRPRRRQPRRRLQTPGNRQLRLGLRHRPLWRGRGGLLPRRRRPAPGSARSHRQDGDPPSQPVLAARAQQPLLGLRPPGPSRRDGHPALRRGVGGDGTEAQSVRAAGREHGALVLRYGGVPRRGGLPPFHPSGHAGRAKVQAAGTQQHRLGPGDRGHPARSRQLRRSLLVRPPPAPPTRRRRRGLLLRRRGRRGHATAPRVQGTGAQGRALELQQGRRATSRPLQGGGGTPGRTIRRRRTRIPRFLHPGHRQHRLGLRQTGPARRRRLQKHRTPGHLRVQLGRHRRRPHHPPLPETGGRQHRPGALLLQTPGPQQHLLGHGHPGRRAPTLLRPGRRGSGGKARP